MNKIVTNLLPSFNFYSFRFSDLNQVDKGRSTKGLKGITLDYNSNLIQKEFIIPQINKSFFVGVINQPRLSNFDIPNVSFIFKKEVNIYSNFTLDFICEFIIANGLKNLDYFLLAKELNALVAISSFIDSPKYENNANNQGRIRIK
ncbi:MAG: hypothetical protein IPJ43_03535 [Saprospiraceae bacterium]|nr:hypothetical protein [Saprospiraceae bacterium]